MKLKTFSLLLLLIAAPVQAQVTGKICENDLPCLPGYVGKVAHAASHALLAVGIAESLRLLDRNWNATDRYLLATVAVPLAWEIIDYWQWQGFKGPPPRASVYDLLSYQGAWVVPLIRKKKYWQAALVFVAWGTAIAVWELER
jgi:hypothetical protein